MIESAAIAALIVLATCAWVTFILVCPGLS